MISKEKPKHKRSNYLFVFEKGAVVASCIQPSKPVVTFAIAVLVGQEKLDFNRFLGLTFAVVGAVCVVVGDIFWTGKSAEEMGKNSIFGDVCLIANCIAMGFCYVLVKQLNKIYSPVVVIAWIYTYAAVCLIFTALFMFPLNSSEVRKKNSLVFGPSVSLSLCFEDCSPNNTMD